MGASSVTGVGQSSAGKRIAYRSESANSNLDLNPRVVSAGLITLNGSGEASVALVDFFGTLVASCDANTCAWNATIKLAVGTSYNQGDSNYAAIRWEVLTDDPTFTPQELAAGTAPKPKCQIMFYGQPNATVSYIVSTLGNRT